MDSAASSRQLLIVNRGLRRGGDALFLVSSLPISRQPPFLSDRHFRCGKLSLQFDASHFEGASVPCGAERAKAQVKPPSPLSVGIARRQCWRMVEANERLVESKERGWA